MDPLSREEEGEIARKRRAFYIFLAGIITLLLPLLGLAYINRDALLGGGALSAKGLFTFDKRVGGPRVIPTSAAAPITMRRSLLTPADSKKSASKPADSLGFIRGGSDYNYNPETPAAAPKKEPPLPQTVVEKEPVPAKKTAKAGPKPVNAPRLKPMKSGGFGKPSSFAGSKLGKQKTEGSGQPDISELMENMPAGGAGMPDIGQMMKNMPPPPESK